MDIIWRKKIIIKKEFFCKSLTWIILVHELIVSKKLIYRIYFKNKKHILSIVYSFFFVYDHLDR